MKLKKLTRSVVGVFLRYRKSQVKKNVLKMFIELDSVAALLGKQEFSELSPIDQSFIRSAVATVEACVSRFYVDLREVATYTEFLPVMTSNGGGDYDLSSIEIENGRAHEFIHSSSSNALILSRGNVSLSGLQVWEDRYAKSGQAPGAFGSDTLLTQGVDYYLETGRPGASSNGILRRVHGAWSEAARSIKVTYVTGRTTLSEHDLALISHVVSMSVLHNYRFWKSTSAVSRDGAPITSESIEAYSYTIGSTPNLVSSSGNVFGGFNSPIPDEFSCLISHLYNWGNVI